MYDHLMPKNPIRQTESSGFDKFTKVITLCFVLIGIVLGIAVSVLHSYIDIYSNESDYQDQIGVLGYISQNVNSTPVKNVYFRSLFCDGVEETVQLFPWRGNVTLNYWQNQLICVERYKSMNYTESTCSNGQTQCGLYCVPVNEGGVCPITQIEISPLRDNADEVSQVLEDNRALYITRDYSVKGQQGIYRIEVNVDAFPCINQARKNLGGLAEYLGYPEYTQKCDIYGIDSTNSQKIETIVFSKFLTESLKLQKSNDTLPTTIKPSAVAILTKRQQIKFSREKSGCSTVDYNRVNDVQGYADDIENIGLIYMIIKSILSCLIVILCVLEIIFLKGRLHYDLKIITVLFKMLTIVLFTFFLIEGGLIIHQISLKERIDDYFRSYASNQCFPQAEISNIFSEFPNLFSRDMLLFILFYIYCMVLIGVLEGILLILYIIQMIMWCKSKRGDQQLRPRQYIDEDFTKLKQTFNIAKDTHPVSDREQQIPQPNFEMANLSSKQQSKKY